MAIAQGRVHPESPAAQLRKMLLEYGWSQSDLAYIIGINVVNVNQLVNGKRGISPELAKLLSAAFDKPPEVFTDMQTSWSLKNIPDASADVRARAYAHSRYPIREMTKRGWLNSRQHGPGEHLELCKFFGVTSLESISTLPHAARRTEVGQPSGDQMAWLFRVRSIAREMQAPPYSKTALENAITRMASLRQEPEEIRHVAKLLEESGVRFVIVEGLSGGKIDGVCTWLNNHSPVIGLSLRFDRIDNFWFVLRHECAHVLHGHGKSNPRIDADINSETQDIDAEEKIANAEATEFCVPNDKMRSFFLRKQPLFSDIDVRAFAKIHHVHPGIVVGQLQNMSGQFNLLRHHLVSVRKFVTASTLTDGWGRMISVNQEERA